MSQASPPSPGAGSTSSDRASSPRSDRAERTRRRILDAAGQCFAASGFSKTTVEEIAAQAGVSKGIVYHHFRGKEGLLESLVEHVASEWIAVSGLESWRARSANLEEALAGMVRGSLAFARDNPMVRALFVLDPLVTMGIGSNERLHALVEESRGRMQRALQEGVDSGQLRGDLDVVRMANVVRMLNMAMVGHLMDPEWIDVSDEGFVETCLEVLFRGISSGAAR